MCYTYAFYSCSMPGFMLHSSVALSQSSKRFLFWLDPHNLVITIHRSCSTHAVASIPPAQNDPLGTCFPGWIAGASPSSSTKCSLLHLEYNAESNAITCTGGTPLLQLLGLSSPFYAKENQDKEGGEMIPSP